MKIDINWPQFIVSVLGTAIGVALTFGLNGVRNQRKQAMDQRLTAIMVIHDIDESIDILKSKKETEEKQGKLLEYALAHRDELETMSYDTLSQIVNSLLKNTGDFRFDTSKEKIFNSDLDTWQNLGNMKFIDNVQSFFFDRQTMQEWLNHLDIWVRPIARDEYMQQFMGIGWLTQEQASDILRRFLKEKLYDKRVTYFIDVATYRLLNLNQEIDSWTLQNEENKFLMGITDRELEEYINSMDINGIRVTRRNLIGTWSLAMEDNNISDYLFRSDNSFTLDYTKTTSGHWEYWSGTLGSHSIYSGTWEMKGDSLIMNIDPLSGECEVDVSGLVPVEGKRDSLNSWMQEYREQLLNTFKDRPEGDHRYAFKACLDSSKDKMKWTDDEDDVYFLKRK